MKYIACNVCCFKMDNFVNKKVSEPKADEIELEIHNGLSTEKGVSGGGVTED